MTEATAIPRRLVTIAFALAILVALGAGGVAGTRLGERASRADARELKLVAPDSLPTRAAVESTSAAGFTGFGGPPALQGEVLRRGTASEGTAGRLELIDGAATTTVDYSTSARLYRIALARGPLAEGDAVIVRIEGTRATGILRARLGGDGSR